MPDRRTITRRAAFGSIAVGATFIVHNTYSFSSTSADRTSNVDTTDDGSALLGVEGTAADATPAFSKNVDSDMTVTLTAPYEPSAEFDVGPDENWESSVSFSITDSTPVEVDMRADVQSITVAITGDFTGGLVEMERDFQIPQAGHVDVTATVKSAGKSGKFTFGVANYGSIDAEMVGIRVDSTTSNGVTVTKNDIFHITKPNSRKRRLVWTDLDVGPGEPVTGFEDANGDPDSVTLPASEDDTQAGQEITFQFNRFHNSNDKGADMENETVTITIEFADGSTGQYTLDDS